MSDYEVFAESYDRLHGDLADDIPFWLSLAKEADGPVLELAVGTGRVALPLARAGIPVTGLDRSPAMLDHLRAKLAREELPVTVIEGDMRTFDATDRYPFKLIYCPFRAFLSLLEPEDQLAALTNVRRHLAGDGLFAGAVFFPDVSLLHRNANEPPDWLEFKRVTDPNSGRVSVLYEKPRADLRRQRLNVLVKDEVVSRDGVTETSRQRELVLTWIWPRELEHLLARAGFDLVHLYGDFERTPFSKGGGELVWVAQPSSRP